jgi:hypothetical protein
MEGFAGHKAVFARKSRQAVKMFLRRSQGSKKFSKT